MTEQERREIVKAARLVMEETHRRHEAWRATGYDHRCRPVHVPFPPGYSDLTCMARTKAGTPCNQKGLYSNGRCKLHGGLSTGPKTPEGKQKASRNGATGRRGKRTP